MQVMSTWFSTKTVQNAANFWPVLASVLVSILTILKHLWLYIGCHLISSCIAMQCTQFRSLLSNHLSFVCYVWSHIHFTYLLTKVSKMEFKIGSRYLGGGYMQLVYRVPKRVKAITFALRRHYRWTTGCHLPVQWRINFKLASLTFSCLNYLEHCSWLNPFFWYT